MEPMDLQPKPVDKDRPSGPTVRRNRAGTLSDLQSLKEYPFLRAALEDLEELQLCASRESTNRRHVVCLMFDALEFVLYEILLLHERDIYRTGQNTIGFDDALSICQETGIEIPLIGTIRQIQKHRGDAKHHAQTPDEIAYQRMLGNFEIIVSRLVYEQFERVLGETLKTLPLFSHRLALFESYRRRRNHNWEQAYRFVLGALLQKHREMFESRSGLAFDFAAGHIYQLDILEMEIAATDYKVAPQAAVGELKNLVAKIRESLSHNNWEKAALLVGAAYSTTDKLLPGIFDIGRAKHLTSKLYQPASFRYGKPMAWSKAWGRQGSEDAMLAEAIVAFLKANSKVVKKFGEPHFETDDDRYWRWWEFAIFDGERWHTFHLDTSFHIALETGPDSSNDNATSTKLLKLILEEFRDCKEIGETL